MTFNPRRFDDPTLELLPATCTEALVNKEAAASMGVAMIYSSTTGNGHPEHAAEATA